MGGTPRDRELIVVVPAAGHSRRWRDGGAPGHKALLQVDHRVGTMGVPREILSIPGALRAGGLRLPMLLWTLMYRPAGSQVLVGARTPDVGPLVQVLQQLGHGHRVVDVGASSTDGQADTVRRVLRTPRARDPEVLVLNCDVVPSAGILDLLVAFGRASGAPLAVLVEPSTSPAMSYVDRVPWFRRAAEKERISQWALTGAYWFASARNLQDRLEGLDDRARHGGELYLSGALRASPYDAMGLSIACDPGTVLDWGTPEALAATGARLAPQP